VTAKDVVRIVDEHLLRDAIVTDLLHRPGKNDPPYETASEMPFFKKQHKIVLVTGHSEYWSLEQFNGFKAAIAAGGTNIASFSANTAYWKVRYENNARSMVCFKTVQGDGSGGSGRVTPNDFGPDRLLRNVSEPDRPKFEIIEGQRDLTTPRSKVLGRDSSRCCRQSGGDPA